MAGACDFDRVALGPLGIPTLQVRVDGSIASATSIQLGLVLQAAVVIVAEKLSAKLSTCERAMKAACSGKVGCEQFMKLRGVEICETVWGLLYRARFGEVARKALSVV